MHQKRQVIRITYIMRKDYEKLFARLPPPELPARLFDKIIARIQEEERLVSLKKQFFAFSSFAAISLTLFVPVFKSFQAEFAHSGFSQFFSLIFSDLNLIMVNWQDFYLALLESLPILPVLGLLTITFVFLWSLRYIALTVHKFTLRKNFNF